MKVEINWWRKYSEASTQSEEIHNVVLHYLNRIALKQASDLFGHSITSGSLSKQIEGVEYEGKFSILED